MTKTKLKDLIQIISNRLHLTNQEIINIGLVSITDHQQLKESSDALDEVYSILDRLHQNSAQNNFEEPMEYISLVKSRVDALIEYVRPYRFKNCQIDYVTVTNAIEHEIQALQKLIQSMGDIANHEHSEGA